MKVSVAKHQPQEIRSYLSDSLVFHGLSDSAAAQVQELSHIHRYEKGEMLFMHGEEASSYFIIISGWVKLFRQTVDGKETVAGLFTRRDALGEAAFFEGAKHPFSAEAVEPCDVIKVNATQLRTRLKDDNVLAMNLLQAVSKHKQALEMQLEHMALMVAPQRIGCFFLRLCSSTPQGSAEFTLPVDKALLAAHLGMKPETFSRALAQLKEVGVQTEGHRVMVKNVQKLAEFTCVSCSDDGDCLKGKDS